MADRPSVTPRPGGAKFVEPRFKTYAPPKKKPGWVKPKRARVKPISDKKAALRPAERAVAEACEERDGGCLLAHHGDCFGRLTPHHRRKSSQGGKWTELNIMTLCESHNSRLEADEKFADWGLRHGVVLKRTDFAAFQLTGCPRSCPIDHRPPFGWLEPLPTEENP